MNFTLHSGSLTKKRLYFSFYSRIAIIFVICILLVCQDACQWESYKAECARDEVVVIQAALYERMSYGRCVKRDYGYMGCFADAS